MLAQTLPATCHQNARHFVASHLDRKVISSMVFDLLIRLVVMPPRSRRLWKTTGTANKCHTTVGTVRPFPPGAHYLVNLPGIFTFGLVHASLWVSAHDHGERCGLGLSWNEHMHPSCLSLITISPPSPITRIWAEPSCSQICSSKSPSS